MADKKQHTLPETAKYYSLRALRVLVVLFSCSCFYYSLCYYIVSERNSRNQFSYSQILDLIETNTKANLFNTKALHHSFLAHLEDKPIFSRFSNQVLSKCLKITRLNTPDWNASLRRNCPSRKSEEIEILQIDKQLVTDHYGGNASRDCQRTYGKDACLWKVTVTVTPLCRTDADYCEMPMGYLLKYTIKSSLPFGFSFLEHYLKTIRSGELFVLTRQILAHTERNCWDYFGGNELMKYETPVLKGFDDNGWPYCDFVQHSALNPEGKGKPCEQDGAVLVNTKSKIPQCELLGDLCKGGNLMGLKIKPDGQGELECQ